MSQQPIITFLIPVYHVNLNDFAVCLASIRTQSILNKIDYEILIVVDGQQENLDILSSSLIQGQDLRLIVQQHAGEAVARNRGIEEAHGKYLIFVDADDCLDPNAAERLVGAAQKHDADAAFANHSRIVGNTKIPIRYFTNQDYCNSKEVLLKHILSVGTDQGTVWAKLFSVKYLRLHKLQFKKQLVNGVDQEFMVRFALTRPSVAIIPDDVYLYKYNTNSVVRKYDPRYSGKVLNTVNEIELDLKHEKAIVESVYQLYLCDRILLCLMNYVFNPAANISFSERREHYRELLDNSKYSNALRKANFSELDLPRRIVLQCCRMRWFAPVWLITRLRQVEKRTLDRQATKQTHNEELWSV